MKKFNTKYFIDTSKLVHGDKYDYSKSEYVSSNKYITIICPIHGEFTQIALSHMNGAGCFKCNVDKRRYNNFIFIEKACKIHGDKYDYSKVEYVNANTKVCIICPKHGEFMQYPAKHLSKEGCPDCKKWALRKILYGKGILDVDWTATKDKEYYIWNGMLQRCYYYQYKNRVYSDCEVCEKWFLYSNFYSWAKDNYVYGYQLDKDILVKGNKVYSPETCCFVPQEINKLIVNRKNYRGRFLIGINIDRNKYTVCMNKYGKRKTIGRYDTEIEAFIAYKTAKEEYIKEVAQEYYDKGLIKQNVYEALIKYEVEITD